MKRMLKLSAVVLAAALLSALLLPLISSADSVYLTVIRYDGVDNIMYDPCYGKYGIRVDGAPEDAEITYRWQVNVAGIVGSHEWLEASDCTWTWDYFTPMITIHVNEGYWKATPENRFCLRCLVKVDGKQYTSSVFEIITRESHYYESVDVADAVLPKVGAKPVQTGRFTTGHLTADNMIWNVVDSNGYYQKMQSGEVFQSGKTYAAEFFATAEESWFIQTGVTKASVNGSPARVMGTSRNGKGLVVIQEYYMDGTTCVPLGYNDNLESMIHFSYSEMVPQPEEAGVQEMDVELKEGQSFTFSFPYAPLESWAVSEGYLVRGVWALTEGDNSVASGVGTSATYSGWVAGKQYELTVYLVLGKNGKMLFPTVTKQFLFHINVTKVDTLPVITHQSPMYLDYSDGQNVIIRCTASGQNLKYQWLRYGLRSSRFGDPYYTWIVVSGYEPNLTWDKTYFPGMLTVNDAGAEDDRTMYMCRVKNDAGTVESRIFTLHRINYPLEQVTVTSDAFSKSGKAQSLMLYWAEEGIDFVDGSLYVSNDSAATASANSYISFINTVNPVSEGTKIDQAKDYYVGLRVTPVEGYTFAAKSDLSVTLNMTKMKVLEWEESGYVYCILKVDPLASSGSGLLGDVNEDGLVNAKDYMLVKRHVLGTAVLTGKQLENANVNGDETVNAKDYIIIKRIALKTYNP